MKVLSYHAQVAAHPVGELPENGLPLPVRLASSGSPRVFVPPHGHAEAGWLEDVYLLVFQYGGSYNFQVFALGMVNAPVDEVERGIYQKINGIGEFNFLVSCVAIDKIDEWIMVGFAFFKPFVHVFLVESQALRVFFAFQQYRINIRL